MVKLKNRYYDPPLLHTLPLQSRRDGKGSSEQGSLAA